MVSIVGGSMWDKWIGKAESKAYDDVVKSEIIVELENAIKPIKTEEQCKDIFKRMRAAFKTWCEEICRQSSTEKVLNKIQVKSYEEIEQASSEDLKKFFTQVHSVEGLLNALLFETTKGKEVTDTVKKSKGLKTIISKKLDELEVAHKHIYEKLEEKGEITKMVTAEKEKREIGKKKEPTNEGEGKPSEAAPSEGGGAPSEGGGAPEKGTEGGEGAEAPQLNIQLEINRGLFSKARKEKDLLKDAAVRAAEKAIKERFGQSSRRTIEENEAFTTELKAKIADEIRNASMKQELEEAERNKIVKEVNEKIDALMEKTSKKKPGVMSEWGRAFKSDYPGAKEMKKERQDQKKSARIAENAVRDLRKQQKKTQNNKNEGQ